RKQFGGKFREAAERDGAIVGARIGAKIGSHAAQIFLNLTAGAARGASARHGCSHFGQTGRDSSRGGVATAEIELTCELRDVVRFNESDLEPVRKFQMCALRPNDGALGAELRYNCKRIGGCGAGHHAAPFFVGRRTTMARRAGSRYFCAAARTCSGVTLRKPSR